MKKLLTILILILIIAGGIYGYVLWRQGKLPMLNNITTTTDSGDGFAPFGRGMVKVDTGTSSTSTGSGYDQLSTSTRPVVLPVLRKIYALPVGGYVASTTKLNASTTLSFIRFIDRGTGYVYEANEKDLNVLKLSNTTLPRVYESYWDRSATKSILVYMKENTDAISRLYTELRATGATSTTPYELRGKFLSENTKEVAVSPKGDKVFSWSVEGEKGVGTVMSFDGQGKLQLFDSPLTEVNVAWPSDGVISVATKGYSKEKGVLYFFDIKNATFKKILGGINGITAKASTDANRVIYSETKGNTVNTKLFVLKDSSTQEVVFRTLADKCVWSTLEKSDLYCAVPTDFPAESYPDAWYQGKVSFVDKIWHIDTDTGEVHLLADLLSLSKTLIDAVELTLDPKEHLLYFVNKNDLSLWSLDLTR